jgi:hypothetical protein
MVRGPKGQEKCSAYCKRNWRVTARCIATGLPSSVAAWYFHWRSASMAACCNKEGPDTTFIVVTRPVASINASMRTSPAMC